VLQQDQINQIYWNNAAHVDIRSETTKSLAQESNILVSRRFFCRFQFGSF